MSKGLKKFLIVIVGIVVAAGLGVGGYFLFNNLASVTVSNLQILNKDFNPINDTSKYLLTNSENRFSIYVDLDTSANSENYSIYSSNPEVAKVVREDGSLYVEYYKAGKTTISAYSNAASSVKDSFVLNVYDNFVADVVIDEKEDNTLTVFGDGTTNVYSYKATGLLEEENCNNMQLRVVENYDKNTIEKIEIDQETQKINIKSKLVTEDSNQTFYLQSYYIDADGVEHVEKNFAYRISVIGYRMQCMQLLISQDYTFTNTNYVYLNSAMQHPFEIEGDTIVQNICLTQDVDRIFFKVRVLYSNHTYKDVSYDLDVSTVDTTFIKLFGGNTSRIDYWGLQVDTQNMDLLALEPKGTALSTVTFTYEDKQIKKSIRNTFKFSYYFKSGDSYNNFINNDLYAKVYQNNNVLDSNFLHYSYIYWDTRFRRIDAITNEKGNIVGFTHGAPVCDSNKDIIITEPTE